MSGSWNRFSLSVEFVWLTISKVPGAWGYVVAVNRRPGHMSSGHRHWILVNPWLQVFDASYVAAVLIVVHALWRIYEPVTVLEWCHCVSIQANSREYLLFHILMG